MRNKILFRLMIAAVVLTLPFILSCEGEDDDERASDEFLQGRVSSDFRNRFRCRGPYHM